MLIKKDIKAQGYTDVFLRRFIISSIDYVVYMKDYKIQEIAKLTYDEEENKILKQIICINNKEGGWYMKLIFNILIVLNIFAIIYIIIKIIYTIL